MALKSAGKSSQPGLLWKDQIGSTASRSDSTLPAALLTAQNTSNKPAGSGLERKPVSGELPVVSSAPSPGLGRENAAAMAGQRAPSGGGGMGGGGMGGGGMGGGGTGGGGIGGGGGSPGGGTPAGGGGGGGRPGETTAGNNLSVPAIFIGTAPELRGDPGQYLFSTPATPTVAVPTGYVYFAQGVEGNEWQADSITTAGPVVVDYVNIGDALESAPIKQGGNVRLELTLFERVADVADLDDQKVTDLIGFEMQLLGGAKGKGSPSKTGPTESQGARYPTTSEWQGDPFEGDAASAPAGVTYETPYASVYAADASATTESETDDSYMRLAIQKVTGLNPGYATDQSAVDGALKGVNDGLDLLTGVGWDGTKWVDTNPGDSITVGDNLANVNFGPELTISGTYNVGASGKPWKFTAEGVYLITFALEQGAPISFDGNTLVRNDDPALSGFQPAQLSEGRLTQVVPEGSLSFGGPDTHNGLLAMLVAVPSSP